MSPTSKRRRGEPGQHLDAAAGHKDPSTRRKLKLRPPIAVQPVFASQLNCEQLLGVNSRRYLDIFLPLCAGHVIPLGKLRLVPLEVAVDALRSMAIADGSPAVDAGDSDDDDLPVTAEQVRRRMGRELVGAR